MSETAAELATQIQTARRKLERPGLPWSYAGGTLQSPLLRKSIAEHCGAPVPPVFLRSEEGSCPLPDWQAGLWIWTGSTDWPAHWIRPALVTKVFILRFPRSLFLFNAPGSRLTETS